MDPNTVQTPNFSLPPVQENQPRAVNPNLQPGVAEVPPVQSAEGRGLETVAPPAALPPVDPAAAAQLATSMALPQATASAQVASTATDQPVDTGLVADDGDLIEKAWVLKAKAIVNQTLEDPYQQNKQMNRVKSEYIKKRYNKDVKVNDE